MSSNTNTMKKINGSDIHKIIMICLVVGLFLYPVIYWFGGQREADNAEDALKRWTPSAIEVHMEKNTIHSFENSLTERRGF